MNIKKTFILFTFCAFISTVSAQVNLGFSGGGLTSFIVGQSNYGFTELDYNRKFGFFAGLQGSYQINEKWSIGTEFNYILVGQDYNSDFDGLFVSKEQDLYYWQIPVLLKANLKSNEKSNLYVQGGVFAAFLRKAEIVWAFEDEDNTLSFAEFHSYENRNPNLSALVTSFGGAENPTADKNLFEKTAFGGIVALGREWTAKENSNFFMELRSGFIFSDINAEAYRYDAPSGTYTASRPLYVGLRLGLNFKL